MGEIEMLKLKRILVPHDFGETSTTSMKYAAALAKMFGAQIDVLHVVEKTGGTVVAPPEMDQGMDFHVRNGTPHDEITRYARERESDLIVMGTHGRSGLAHAMMGSVAEKVVRTAPCPVLTIRGPQRDFARPNILVATDFGAASDTALAYGRSLAYIFGGTLHLLHVMESHFMQPVVADPHALEARARQELGGRLTNDDRVTLHATSTLAVSDRPAPAIAEYAKAANIDFIVIGTHGRQSTDRLLMGSVAEHVVRTASCPVLTVKHPVPQGMQRSFGLSLSR